MALMKIDEFNSLTEKNITIYHIIIVWTSFANGTGSAVSEKDEDTCSYAYNQQIQINI